MKRKILAYAVLSTLISVPSMGLCAESNTVTTVTTTVTTVEQVQAPVAENVAAVPSRANIVETNVAPVAEVKENGNEKTVAEAVEKEAAKVPDKEVPEFQRVQLKEANLSSEELASAAGNKEAIVELMKKNAVALVIASLKNPNFDYTSDFSELVSKYSEYVIDVNVVDKDGITAKIDVRSAMLNAIVQAKRIPKKVKEIKPVLVEQKPINAVPSNGAATAVTAPVQETTNTPVQPVEQEVVDNQQNTENNDAVQSTVEKNPTSPTGRDDVSAENVERRHKWAMGYSV